MTPSESGLTFNYPVGDYSPQSKSFRCLGVIINNYLKWTKDHLDID